MLRVAHRGIEMSQGIHTNIAQLAAEALAEFRCTLAHIAVAETSTDIAPTPPPLLHPQTLT